MPRSEESTARGKRQHNCTYWKQNYGVYINPDDLENYMWFKKNRSLCVKLLPLMTRLKELTTPPQEENKEEDTNEDEDYNSDNSDVYFVNGVCHVKGYCEEWDKMHGKN
jgi:hypothetical protein